MLNKFFRDFGAAYAGNALVGFIFAASGPVAIILAVGAQGGLSESDLSSWIFGSFFLNGLVSIAFCLWYRQPLVFFWTIPGAVLVGPALGHLTFAEVIGAYLATGVLMAALGLSGWVRRCTEAAPMPIVMAMVAGVFLRFGTGLVHAVRDDIKVAAPMVLAFILLSFFKHAARWMPPLIGALLAGTMAIFLSGSFDSKSQEILSFAPPNLY
ncbi:MAG: benzoate/H(+) symporter BenE family transporter, partial [Pseudomonadota bacterium]